MRKNVLWTLAAFILCGLALTSCWKEERNAGLLLGNWFLTQETESDEDIEITYSSLSFGENGVVTTRNYWIFPDEPANHNERMLRHYIFTVDEASGLISLHNGEEVQTFRYQLTGNQFTVTTTDGSITATYQRPTAAELERLDIYDQFIWSNDYIGRWFYVNKWDNDLTIYGMLLFDEDGKLKHLRYSLYGEDDCIRAETTMLYNDYGEEKDKMIEIHEPKDYSISTKYYWSIVNGSLVLQIVDDENDDPLICRPLTPDDIDLMAKLDKLVK